MAGAGIFFCLWQYALTRKRITSATLATRTYLFLYPLPSKPGVYLFYQGQESEESKGQEQDYRAKDES